MGAWWQHSSYLIKAVIYSHHQITFKVFYLKMNFNHRKFVNIQTRPELELMGRPSLTQPAVTVNLKPYFVKIVDFTTVKIIWNPRHDKIIRFVKVLSR